MIRITKQIYQSNNKSIASVHENNRETSQIVWPCDEGEDLNIVRKKKNAKATMEGCLYIGQT